MSVQQDLVAMVIMAELLEELVGKMHYFTHPGVISLRESTRLTLKIEIRFTHCSLGERVCVFTWQSVLLWRYFACSVHIFVHFTAKTPLNTSDSSDMLQE